MNNDLDFELQRHIRYLVGLKGRATKVVFLDNDQSPKICGQKSHSMRISKYRFSYRPSTYRIEVGNDSLEVLTYHYKKSKQTIQFRRAIKI